MHYEGRHRILRESQAPRKPQVVVLSLLLHPSILSHAGEKRYTTKPHHHPAEHRLPYVCKEQEDWAGCSLFVCALGSSAEEDADRSGGIYKIHGFGLSEHMIMGHRGELRSLSSNSSMREDIYNRGEVVGPNLASSLRYYTLPDGEASSSSSCSSVHEQGLENDRMIAQLLSEEIPPANDDIGKRLTHLSSMPLQPRVNSSIPTVSDSTSDHQRLLERLHIYGLRELKMVGDGNCQFRALAHQLYQTPEFHKFVRKQVVHQLKTCRDLYEGYVPMKYGDYVKRMNRSGEWGDHVTLQAAADHFGVKIYLVTSFRETCFIEITPKQVKSKRDLFLSFWSEIHYNSIYTGSVITGTSDVKRKKKHWLF